MHLRLTFVATLAVFTSCGPDGLLGDDSGVGVNDLTGRGTAQAATPSPVPETPVIAAPAENPTTAAKIALGRLLFWDPLLSGDRDVACATCHHPDFAYTDGRALSIGVGGTGLGPLRIVNSAAPHRTTRNSMTVLNTAFNGSRDLRTPVPADTAPMFWDSRAHGLEAQARGPITALDEMLGTGFTASTIFPEVVRRVGAVPEYVGRFDDAFGADSISEQNIVQAIAAFERTLTSLDTSFDRFQRGDTTALSAAAQRGLATFNTHGCAGCHNGAMFSDFQLHRLGVAGNSQDDFRTGGLRNIARTAPYMHDGTLTTLNDVFAFYARVDRTLDPRLQQVRPFDANERADVTAFFAALSDGTFDRMVPEAVPSGLPVGGAIH